MIIVFGQYHSSLIQTLRSIGEPFEILKDAKRYTDNDAIDFSDPAKVLAAVRSITPAPKAVIAMYEQYIPLAAEISAKVGISHALTPEAAIKATDKIAMRNAFEKENDISPHHAEANNINDALEFVKKYDYPVIVKPSSLSKSMLITRCNNDIELKQAYESITKLAPDLFKKYTLNQKPKFIIEQFMEGSIHTIAAFIDSRGNVSFAPGIVDNISAQEVGYDDTFIFQRSLPTSLSKKQQANAYDCAKKAIRALELRSCPAHVELIMTDSGARVIEIGARLGGYRPAMYQLANNTNLIEAAVHSYMGSTLDLSPQTDFSCAVVELFPRESGTIIKLEGMEIISRLETVSTFKQIKSVGDNVGRAADGYKAIAYVILSHEDSSRVVQDANTIRETFEVETSSAKRLE